MLDFSFGELAIIGAVALVVLGPEKLPKVARTAGQWVSKAQRYVNDVKADIQRETELAELKKLQQDVQNSARELESSLHQNLSSIESDLSKTANEATAVASAVGEPAAADQTIAFGERYEDSFGTRGVFVKPAPTVESLAAELENLQRELGGAGRRFKYAPRARSTRGPRHARR